ncbi:MAG: glycerol-3-phosphate dehydrogenase, partial [Actinobacteria bacterium]|nr:glycerol-3-phosphate dehydrogenase [Actinomycetota bacterium]
VLAVQAGLRPLIDAKPGATSLASREDRLISPGPGIIAVAGGKLTTYRRMAERVVDAILREFLYAKVGHSFKRTVTAELRLTGPYRELEDPSLAQLSRPYLAETYGHDAPAVLAAADGTTPLRDGSPFVWGEVDFAVQHEMAVRLGDVLARRTRVALTDREHGRDIAAAVAARMGTYLGWTTARRADEVAAYGVAAAAYDVPQE